MVNMPEQETDLENSRLGYGKKYWNMELQEMIVELREQKKVSD